MIHLQFHQKMEKRKKKKKRKRKMSKLTNISLLLLICWYVIFWMVGKSTIQWSMLSHAVESCFFIFVILGFRNTGFVVNWVVDLVVFYNVNRVLVCVSYFISKNAFNFLNSNVFLLTFLSIGVLIIIIINRKNNDR